jgi:hypothetical protein
MNVFTPLNLMPPLSGSLQFNAVTDVAQTVPVAANGQNYNLQTRKFRAGSPILSFDDPFAGSAQAKPVNVWMIGPQHQTSNHWQWSFDLQRELPFSTAVTVAYVGSKSTHVGNAYWNWNDPDPSPDTNIQARRPTQRFYDYGSVQSLGQVTYLDSNANSNYNGLQVTAEKRFSKGLAFGLAYTFSKTMGEGEAGGNDTGYVQNPRADRRGSRGRLSFDMQHNTVLHFVYEFPFAQSMHGIAAGILKGWQTNGILSLRSGFPFSLRVGDLNVGSTYPAVRPDRVRDGNLPADERTRKHWFDTGAFQRTTCLIPGRQDLCHYGSAGYNFLDAPGQRNLDFSL